MEVGPSFARSPFIGGTFEFINDKFNLRLVNDDQMLQWVRKGAPNLEKLSHISSLPQLTNTATVDSEEGQEANQFPDSAPVAAVEIDETPARTVPYEKYKSLKRTVRHLREENRVLTEKYEYISKEQVSGLQKQIEKWQNRHQTVVLDLAQKYRENCFLREEIDLINQAKDSAEDEAELRMSCSSNSQEELPRVHHTIATSSADGNGSATNVEDDDDIEIIEYHPPLPPVPVDRASSKEAHTSPRPQPTTSTPATKKTPPSVTSTTLKRRRITQTQQRRQPLRRATTIKRREPPKKAAVRNLRSSISQAEKRLQLLQARLDGEMTQEKARIAERKKPYGCGWCVTRVSSMAALRKHVERFHSGPAGQE